MFVASLIPFIAFGLLALAPMLETDQSTEATDEAPTPDPETGAESDGEDATPPDDPDTTPAVTVSTNGEAPVDALTREGGTETNSNGDVLWVLGTSDADAITTTEESDPNLRFRLDAGDDTISVQLGQDVDAATTADSEDPSGSDNITLQVGAERVAQLQDIAGNAENASELPETGYYTVDETDTVSINIDPAVEGRIVVLVYTEYFLGTSSQESQSQDYRGVFLVPEGVDIEERIADVSAGAPDEDGDFLALEDGAIRLAKVALGGTYTSYDTETGESSFDDSTFEWDSLTANRAIETYTITNTPI